MEPNEHLVSILTFVVMKEGSQAGLAAALEMDPAQITRIKQKRESWSDRRLAIALAKLNETVRDRSGTELSIRDLYVPDTIALIDLLPLTPDERFRLIAKLRLEVPPPSVAPRSDLRLRKFHGLWLNLYICNNPDSRTEPALAIDNFYISPSSQPLAARVRHTNYEHVDKIIPEGTLKICENVVEMDLDYKEDRFPRAKYLAPLPQAEEYEYMLATSLDIKVSERLVVARSTFLYKLWETEQDLVQPGIYTKDTAIFTAAQQFFRRFSEFREVRNELVPRRDIGADDAYALVTEIKRGMQGRQLLAIPASGGN